MSPEIPENPHLASLKQAVARADLTAASAIVRSAWFDLLRSHQPDLRLVLSRIAVEDLRSHPLLALLLGVSYSARGLDRWRGTRYFAVATAAARRSGDTSERTERAFIRAAEAAAYRLLGQPHLGTKPARDAVALLDDLPLADRARTPHVARLYAQLGITLYYGQDQDAALDAFTKGLAEAPDPSQSSSAFGNLAMLAGIHAMEGNIPEARAHLAYARTGVWTEEQRNTYAGTFYRLGEALVALEAFDSATAFEHLQRMQHDRRTIEHWRAIAEVEALARLVSGSPGDALADIDALVATRGTEGRTACSRASLGRLRAILQLALGNPLGAEAALRPSLILGRRTNIDSARVQLALGKTGTALAAIRAAADGPLPARAQAEAAALEAAIMLRISVEPRARRVVEHLGAILSRTEQLLPLALLPPDDHERVVAALRGAGYDELLGGRPLRSLLTETPCGPHLTKRELAMLRALTPEVTVGEIAAQMSVSANTVKTHLRNLYRKLEVSTREDAIAVAIGRNLLLERD